MDLDASALTRELIMYNAGGTSESQGRTIVEAVSMWETGQ